MIKVNKDFAKLPERLAKKDVLALNESFLRGGGKIESKHLEPQIGSRCVGSPLPWKVRLV